MQKVEDMTVHQLALFYLDRMALTREDRDTLTAVVKALQEKGECAVDLDGGGWTNINGIKRGMYGANFYLLAEINCELVKWRITDEKRSEYTSSGQLKVYPPKIIGIHIPAKTRRLVVALTENGAKLTEFHNVEGAVDYLTIAYSDSERYGVSASVESTKARQQRVDELNRKEAEKCKR